jgi:hypothetical protein
MEFKEPHFEKVESSAGLKQTDSWAKTVLHIDSN